MKRLYISIGLVLFVIGAAVSGFIFIRSTMSQVVRLSRAAREEYILSGDAEDEVEELMEFYEGRERLLEIFIDRGTLSGMAVSIYRLGGVVEADSDELLPELEGIEKQAQRISRAQWAII
ncbi:MAG: hypothetical protein IJ737_07230 [Ruminococcus sp.]|nr:hypothetical protein [Ruminococcus sp.]